MNFNRYQLLVSSLVCTLFISPMAGAGKTTVGELFSQAKNAKIVNKEKNAKSATAIPDATFGFNQSKSNVNLEAVKPPRISSVDIAQAGGGYKAEYEKILNQQIDQLYKLTQKFKTSNNRGEMWLRLAELYVEKATIIDTRMQNEYDQKLRDFQEGKIKNKPVLNSAEAREYNKKAVQLYEWFQRDFPKDEKNSQALFFLGYNYSELGEVEKGVHYYEELVKRYPDSQYSMETHFALAEYHFESEKWAAAYKEYAPMIKEKNHRLHTFALYKGAWCLFRLGKTQQGLEYLEATIKISREDLANSGDRKKSNHTHLEGEALRDIVTFYSEGGDPNQAASYFKKVVGGDIHSYLERLAYQYSDRGNKDSSRLIFKLLIDQNPDLPKAFEYQYQIVQNFYYAKNTASFKEELFILIKNYGVNGRWYAQNKGNQELITNAQKLRETTLRNFILQQHQTAQNSRAPFSQGQALEGYQLYFAEFPDSASLGDMHFYFGELLFDMQKFDEAGLQYKWVVDHAPQSKFYEKSAQNLILAIERSTPSDEDIQKKVGSSLEPIPLEPKVERFLTSATWYIETFPKGEKSAEIKYRMGRLYYQANHFDEASKLFRQVVKESPNTKYSEYSANLLLDIFNLKKDFAGLEKTGAELLAVNSIASSKAGSDIRAVLEKTSFKLGTELESQKKYSESALVFQAFAKQNPASTLAATALFNAGVNFERAGQTLPAISAYKGVVGSKDPSADKFKSKAKRLLAKLYQDSAQFEEAAQLYQQAAQENPTDPLSANLIFNSGVLYEALGKGDAAIRSYTEFTKMNKNQSENSDVIFNIAQIHRKANHISAAITNYLDYVEGGGQSSKRLSDKVPEKLVESAFWLSELYRRQRSITKADEWSQKTLSMQKKYSGGRKNIGASFAAKIRLAGALITFNEFKAIRFPNNPVKQKEAADKKVALLTKIASELAEIIKFDSAEEIVGALAILGEANLNMAQTIISAPIPKDLNAEQLKEYKSRIESFAEPFRAKAKESYKLAVQRGSELEVYTEAYRNAYSYMNSTDPKVYYDGGEVGSTVRMVNWMVQ